MLELDRLKKLAAVGSSSAEGMVSRSVSPSSSNCGSRPVALRVSSMMIVTPSPRVSMKYRRSCAPGNSLTGM